MTTARGVKPGATRPYHSFDSTPGNPCEAIVATSGSAAERSRLEIPRGRILPPRTCGTIVLMFCTPMGIWPAIKSESAGPPPLYGTCVISTCATDLNNSPVRCTAVPLPAEPKLNLPGCCFASLISPPIEVAGTDGCTEITLATEIASVIGAKSLHGSKGLLANSAGLMA